MKSYDVKPSLENMLVLLDANSNPKAAKEKFGPFLPLFGSKAKLDRAKRILGDAELAQSLRSFVFRKCFIFREEQIEKVLTYYESLLKGLKTYFSMPSMSTHAEYPDIQVFTTNFDNSVEIFCREKAIPFYDGYNYTNPLGGYVFDHLLYTSGAGLQALKLFKIHGTVRYAKSPNGIFNELQFLPRSGSIVINGHKCLADLIYSGSYQYSSNSPQLELLYLMKQAFTSSDLIIAIGYSFGDPHIVTVFRDVLRKNSSTRLIICSPDPNSTIKNHLTELDSSCITIAKAAEDLDVVRDFRGNGVPQ
jgi:hypothetical protein